ncbi:uncharacterized protein LOC143711200 isoform X2 [Siphateles boraxobius]|uniref:uncharacterized protein LOC143711200 isoform X2 n=1 Tax=Siphateles boraxobius TaxID=180520 RepID=UPI0040637A8A
MMHRFYSKMRLLAFIFVAFTLMVSDGFLVKGPSGPLVVALGSSVVLPCYVDEPLPLKGLKMIWIRTDINTLVHLFVNGNSRPDAQYQDYHDRAHFFTDQIKHGNFSLHLENLRAEDKGFYTCKVFTELDAGETFVEIKEVEYLNVSGSDDPVSAFVGEDVTLNCSVHSHIPPEHIEWVSWRKTDEDENIQVLLLQRNKIQPDSSDERYRDRVEFFTDEIPKGNFSLTLKRTRYGDKGVYMCHVKTGHLSANTTAVLERLGFSVLHTMILALCISASGSALLLFLIHCTLQNDWTAPYLNICLNFLPNIMMFVALILWGISNVICNKWMNYGLWSFIEYSVFTAIVYSVISPYILDSQQFTLFFICLISSTSFVLILFLCLKFCTSCWKNYKTMSNILEAAGLALLGILIFLFYLFVASGLLTAVIFTTGFIPLLASMALHMEDTGSTNTKPGRCSCLEQKGKWFGLVITVNIFMICFYIGLLKNNKGAILPFPLSDHIGWACVIGFLQIKWTLMDLTWTYNKSDCRPNTSVYLFGSVGVVLLSASTLMTELMLKIWNGGRTIDLRIVLFPVESIFALSLLVLQVLTPGEAHAFKGRDSFVVMISFFLILVAFLLVINYIQ